MPRTRSVGGILMDKPRWRIVAAGLLCGAAAASEAAGQAPSPGAVPELSEPRRVPFVSSPYAATPNAAVPPAPGPAPATEVSVAGCESKRSWLDRWRLWWDHRTGRTEASHPYYVNRDPEPALSLLVHGQANTM